ncbi:MAG: hypothetical protein V3T31_01100 [candidate division Zixibacteria bacterium]
MNDSFFSNDPEVKPTRSVPELGGESQNRSEMPGDDRTEAEMHTDDSRLAAIMAYIPFLCFVPLLSMRENTEARFHARQGLLLFIVELVAVIFLIPGVASLVFKVVLIAAAGLSIAGIYFALQGKNMRLPIIGDWVEKSKL